jgi:hypothetical protein
MWQLRDALPYDTWVKGRVILIGDAAHPGTHRAPHAAGWTDLLSQCSRTSWPAQCAP